LKEHKVKVGISRHYQIKRYKVCLKAKEDNQNRDYLLFYYLNE